LKIDGFNDYAEKQGLRSFGLVFAHKWVLVDIVYKEEVINE